MRTLYLHIGHSKTGSSWLQQFLFLNRFRLSDAGIQYWFEQPELNQRDYPENVHWGNGKEVFASKVALESYCKKLPAEGDVLLSAEEIFYDLLYWRRIDFPFAYLRTWGFGQISILLFIRQPIAHTLSTWMEEVKLDIFHPHYSLEERYQQFNRPKLVAEFIEKMAMQQEVTLTIRNYDTCSKNLIGELLTWMDIIGIKPDLPRESVVNRSLTHAEILILRSLKSRGYPAIRALAEQMMRFSPSFVLQKFYPDPTVQREHWERCRPFAETINQTLPEGHAYRFDEQPYLSPQERKICIDRNELKAILDTLPSALSLPEEPLLWFSEKELDNLMKNALAEALVKPVLRSVTLRKLVIHTEDQADLPADHHLQHLFAPYSDITRLLHLSSTYTDHEFRLACPNLYRNIIESQIIDPEKIGSDLQRIREFGFHALEIRCATDEKIKELSSVLPNIRIVKASRFSILQKIFNLFKR